MQAWAAKIADPLIATSDYTYRYMTPQSTYKEDFNFTALGVPSVGTAKGEETVFYDLGYHTNYDSKEIAGFNADTWQWMHELFGMYVYYLDQTPARPLDFAARFKALKESYDEKLVQDEELIAVIDEAIASAKPVTKKINKLNSDYAEAVANGDAETAEALLAEAGELNKQTREVYKTVQDTILWLDGDFSIVFPHETRQDNINNLQGAIKALKKGNAEEARDDYLSSVGDGWYAKFFDEETLTINENSYAEGIKNTWAEGRVDIDNIDVNGVVVSLMEKTDADADYSKEIAKLKELKAEQEEYLAGAIEKEKTGLATVVEALKALK